jgi:hypothetical protein
MPVPSPSHYFPLDSQAAASYENAFVGDHRLCQLFDVHFAFKITDLLATVAFAVSLKLRS